MTRNQDLRRVQLAFAGFNSAEVGAWIAILVYAYRQGGATEAGIVALVQTVPGALFAPVAGALADRHPPARILTLGYVAQAAAMSATAAALLAGGSKFFVYMLAALANTAVTVTRPTQSTLLPALAHKPIELTATNVVSGWIDSLSVLVSPALTGIVLSFSGPGTVFAVMAGVAAASAFLVAPIKGPAPGGLEDEELGMLAETLSGFRALRASPEAQLLVWLLAAEQVVIGALDVLFVVLAVSALDLGNSGVGYLNAAFGAGGVIGIGATVALVGRRRLALPLVGAIGVWSAAFAGIGAKPNTVVAFMLLATAGVGYALFDVSSRTLLQRTSPPEMLSRVFGVVESLSMVGLAVGSLLAPALVALGGSRAAFFGVGAVLPLVALAARRRVATIDDAATVPVVEVGLLRSLPMLAALGPLELERLARSLIPVEVASGESIIREGDRGDRFYVIADGEFEVAKGGVHVAGLGRGAGFGEIALLRNVPRTATVTARGDARAYALDQAQFLAAVTGSAKSTRRAAELMEGRLAELTQIAGKGSPG